MEFSKDLVDVRGLRQFDGLLLSIPFDFEAWLEAYWSHVYH